MLRLVELLLPKAEDGTFLASGPGATGAEEKSDVVHDFLVYLAEQMVELNKRKQAEAKRFLGWLEKQLHILPNSRGEDGLDALTGKTRLRDYLGDYQKGEEHVPFDDFLTILQRNRSRIGVSLSDQAFLTCLRTGYEASLATLLPIKERLAKTDWLIDQVVYRLYGLTEEEIAIVEGER
jgi:hypothetical protein